MKRLTLSLCALLVLGAPLALAQHDAEHDTAAMGPIGPPEEMKKLARLVGEWDVDSAVRMGPEDPWTEGKATSVFTSQLDGGAVHGEFKGEFLGMPMTGLQLFTYDREEKRYESIWIDNFACRVSESHGSIQGDVISWEGTDKHMGQTMHYRIRQAFKGNDAFDFVMESSMDGQNWHDSMRMTYTRKGKAR